MPPGKKNMSNSKAIKVRNALDEAVTAEPTRDDRPGNRTMRQLRDLQAAVQQAVQDIDDATS